MAEDRGVVREDVLDWPGRDGAGVADGGWFGFSDTIRGC